MRNNIDYGIFESVQFIDDFKKNMINVKDLKDQWKKVAGSFVKHKWIYRYIDDKQKETLENHYAVLCDDNSTYYDYKKSFKYICRFMGLPHDKIIIEHLVFRKDETDKDQWEMALRYSKGLAKVTIPDGVRLIHISPVSDIKELIPTFRSKTKGKYMYPSKRIFFTIQKDIKLRKAGIQTTKTIRYTPLKDIKTAYIDPTYSDFGSGAVYIDTEIPVAVETLEKKLFGIFKTHKED